MVADKIYKIHKELEKRNPSVGWRFQVSEKKRDELIKQRVLTIFPNANVENLSSEENQVQMLFKLFKKVSKLRQDCESIFILQDEERMFNAAQSAREYFQMMSKEC